MTRRTAPTLAASSQPALRSDAARRDVRLVSVNGDLAVLLVPLIALIALSFLTRWIFRVDRTRRRQVVPADAVPGLLEPIRTGLRRADGLALRAVLGDAGIRSSMSSRRDGSVDVNVFRADVERARALLPPG